MNWETFIAHGERTFGLRAEMGDGVLIVEVAVVEMGHLLKCR